VTVRKGGCVLRRLQLGLDSVVAWCKRWNIKINKEKAQAVYFSNQIRPPEPALAMTGRSIPFVNSVKYLGVIFGKKIT
jgi:hypothetical protein